MANVVTVMNERAMLVSGGIKEVWAMLGQLYKEFERGFDGDKPLAIATYTACLGDLIENELVGEMLVVFVNERCGGDILGIMDMPL